MSNGKATSIVALPSLSSALHALPNATSIHSIHIHQHMYAQRAAESEAKVCLPYPIPFPHSLLFLPQLQKALSKTAASQNSQPAYQPPSPVRP